MKLTAQTDRSRRSQRLHEATVDTLTRRGGERLIEETGDAIP